MNIADKIPTELKVELGSLVIECQVISKLLKERSATFENKAKEILAELGLSPQMYALKFNAHENIWEAVLKESALALPGNQARKN